MVVEKLNHNVISFELCRDLGSMLELVNVADHGWVSVFFLICNLRQLLLGLFESRFSTLHLHIQLLGSFSHGLVKFRAIVVGVESLLALPAFGLLCWGCSVFLGRLRSASLQEAPVLTQAIRDELVSHRSFLSVGMIDEHLRS